MLLTRRMLLAMIGAETSAACSAAGSGSSGSVSTVRLFSSGQGEDGPVVQAALDRAGLGDTILLAAGEWRLPSLILRRPGVTLAGEGPSTVLRPLSVNQDFITVAAPNVAIRAMRLEGACQAPAPNLFAIRTEERADVRRLLLLDVEFSGARPGLGFSNGLKADLGADEVVVRGCRFERLWGTVPGTGYAVLFGGIARGRIENNLAVALPGRGRHFAYLSAGASDCLVQDNDCSGFAYEGIAIYALGHQPACLRNRVVGNRVTRCAGHGGFQVGAISLIDNVREVVVQDNFVDQSLGSGIVLDAANATRLRTCRLINNKIIDAAYIGIDINAAQDVIVSGNLIRESSHAEPGVHSNIRLASDGLHPPRNILVENNISEGSTFARSPFQINATRPKPVDVRLSGNRFERGNLTGAELNGLVQR